MTTLTPDEVRSAALDAVKTAAEQNRAMWASLERTLGHYLRIALAHGLTVDEVCAASGLDRDEVLRLTDPAGV